MAKVELWDVPVIKWALPRLWGFPVKRGEADRKAMRTASELLKGGELVGMFPEGTRHREAGFGEAHGGVAFVSQLSGAPVVPVGIANTDRIMPEGRRLIRFPRVTMSFGPPIRPENYGDLDRKERVDAMTADIMDRIATELARAKEA
jgi:1-acyl-sn-glycerol-3-phosphate acyltransferase